MELYKIITEVIDLRSFSSLWYWIILAVVWSCSSHWVMGIPFDMVHRARRQGGEAARHLEDLARINTRRFLDTSRTAAVPLFFLVALYSSTLALLAFWYWIEFAQALFLLTIWFIPIGLLSLRLALRIEAGQNEGAALISGLIWLRREIQLIGMLAILITAMFGMWRNLSHSILY